jgi:purine-binding chemotaxis protein CheW
VSAASLDADESDVLTFKVHGERIAVPVVDVAEIIRPRPLTRVPHGPASLLGMINLRGKVLPVVSLAELLGQGAMAPTPSTRVVVVDAGVMVGLLVDEVTALGKASDERRVDVTSVRSRSPLMPCAPPPPQSPSWPRRPAATS